MVTPVAIAPVHLVFAALGVAAIVAVAEWLHARRVARVARLAFGPSARPAVWARAVPVARVLAAGSLAWGLGYLATYDPVEIDTRPAENASKHVLLCFDASPSMHIQDAGPERTKVSRAVWGGRVVQGILDRLDMETTRVTVVAFYTDALTVVKTTFDKEVVRNVLDGLPMYAAFEPGGTDVNKGVREAIEVARPWPKRSTLLVVVTDGDTAGSPPPSQLPSSIADVLVIGVGDPNRATQMWGRPSRQDTGSLRQLATRLGGLYHDGNVKHLPSAILQELSMIQPKVGADVALRDLALFASGVGGFTLALATPLLLLAGRPTGSPLPGRLPGRASGPAFRFGAAASQRPEPGSGVSAADVARRPPRPSAHAPPATPPISSAPTSSFAARASSPLSESRP